MKTLALRTVALVLIVSIFSSSQSQQPAISIDNVTLHLGMEKQDALKKLSFCCKTLMTSALPSLGDSTAMVSNKDDIYNFIGNVYFRNGKVVGVNATRDWSAEPESYKSALALFRLVDRTAHEHSVQATITALTREMTNGSGKSIVISLDNGRSITIELSTLDPGQKIAQQQQQVTVSECLGPC